MLTKKENKNIGGKHVEYCHNDAFNDAFVRLVIGSRYISLPEARAIHAELTELFAILDEK